MLTVNLSPIADAYISLLNPNTNYGFSKAINVNILFHNHLNKNII
ncbi:hypothetical protein [Clostridium intestinale]|nr:hypothetical protein [Clostridium intestinale]